MSDFYNYHFYLRVIRNFVQEQEEEERRVEEEEKKITRRQQQEEIKKVMQETIEMKRKKLKEEKAKQLEEELKEKKIKEQRQRQEDQEKERLRAVELEKARLWKEETERQRRKEEKERILKFEEAKRISSALMERKKLEEEEQKKLKSEIDEGKIKEVEKLKKETLEEKIKKLFDGKKKKENVQEIEKPKKKIANNSMALKFEELSRAAELEEQARKDLQEKKRIMKERTRNIIHRSKQILHKMSKENLKKSQSLLNNENHKITRMNVSSSESKEEMNKKAMQNYLISQVLFDKEENITCSGIKEKQAEVESMEKKINSELRRIKNKEEERALRQQEQHFENYKQEMEKYLQFVCEENKVKKKKKKAAKKEENFPMINRLNIQDIQNSFEENSKQTFTGGTSPDAVTVSKLDTAKFLQPTENPGPKTKENISVIIDKTALKRTISLFEKEKKEKEEQERIAELSKKKDRQSTFWAKHFMNKSQKSSDLAEKDHSLEKSDLEENTILQDSEVLCEAGESIKENGMRKNDVEKMKSLELKRLKNVEEERILRQQEENFELYKQEMEKYLQFVCEENKIKNKKKKVAEKDEPTAINRLNIQDIQNSFEEHLKQSLKTPTSPDRITVNKLDPTKFLQQGENSATKQKENIQVIIDKAAFERTLEVFKKEKKDGESKKSLSSNKEDQKSNFWEKHFMNRSESKPDLLESIKPKDPKPPLKSVKPSDAEREKSSVKQLLEDPIKKVDSYSRKIYNSISGSKDCLTENLSKQRLSIAPQQPAPRLNQFIKPTRPLPSENEDLEDISDSDGELEEYKQQLKEQYAYLDLIHSSRESTPEKNQRKTGSFSSLMNILQTMKKSKISQKYTDSKSRVLNFSDSKPGMSRSEMDLPTVSGSCSNIKQMFDSGSIFSSTRRSSVDQDFRDVIPERKKDFKSFLTSTFEGKEKIKPRNFDDDSDSSSEDLIPKLRQKSNKSEISEEDFNGSQTISSELQALRKCSVMKGFNKLDKGSSQINESRTRPGPVMRLAIIFKKFGFIVCYRLYIL